MNELPLTGVGKIYKPGLRLRPIERVIDERLERDGLAGKIRVSEHEGASGLPLTVTPVGVTSIDEVSASVQAILSRFAISWSWTA